VILCLLARQQHHRPLSRRQHGEVPLLANQQLDPDDGLPFKSIT
jgi:hypothetical protein